MKLPQNYAVSYLLWFVSFALTLLALLSARILVLALFSLTGANYWVMSFIDRAGILMLGIAGLVVTLFLEHYYRRGVDQMKLWKRFGVVTVMQFVIVVAGGLASLLPT